MGQPNVAHEPSMEEILASIRQIISDDGDRGQAKPKAEAAAAPKPAEEPPIIAPAAPAPQPVAVQPAVAAEEKPQMSAPKPYVQKAAAPAVAHEMPVAYAAPAFEAAPTQSRAAAPMVSEETDVAVAGAFSALAHTILSQNARTLEDLVSEMLNPMLSEWLDENLPQIVERLVRSEIERVSRGRR